MSESMMSLTQDTWDREVIQSKGVSIVFFWTPWCGHCKMFAPIFEEVAQAFAGRIKFAKLNCEEFGGVASACQVMGTPTMLIFRDGAQVDKILGGLPKANLEKKFEEILAG